MTLEEWREEGLRVFGKDVSKWEFVCPACGHVSSIQDFLDLGGDVTVDDAYVNCIGRFNGKGEDGIKGKDKGFGCNWAAYGLFGCLNKGNTIITPNGKKVQIFAFNKK